MFHKHTVFFSFYYFVSNYWVMYLLSVSLFIQQERCLSWYIYYFGRNFWKLDEDAPDIVKSCLKFLHSDAMFLVLSSLTGIKLHELADISDDDEDEENTSKPKGKKEYRNSTLYCVRSSV